MKTNIINAICFTVLVTFFCVVLGCAALQGIQPSHQSCDQVEKEIREIAWDEPDAFDFDNLLENGTKSICEDEETIFSAEYGWMEKEKLEKMHRYCREYVFRCYRMGK